MNKSFFRENLAVGFMLFALFLGAGNIIFPTYVGYEAGENYIQALIGFLITGVGLPLLGVIAIAKTGQDLQTLGSKLAPWFGILFTSIVYLAIGPFFAIPRTATVSYEIAIVPFLSNTAADSRLPLFLFSVVFFAITFYLASNPSKLADRVGKILTPALLIVIILIALKSFITPLGDAKEPGELYLTNSFGQGFIDGYGTMDVLASLVFGIVVINALKAKGITEKKHLMKTTIISGIIAAIGLAFVYISLAYLGMTSPDTVGLGLTDGGSILTHAAKSLYGSAGLIILAAVIILACLTTSVGLISSCATYFNQLLPRFSYKKLAVFFTLFSLVAANFGLANIMAISTPFLMFVYPIAIVLMFLSFIDHLFDEASIVYGLALLFTALVSLNDGLVAAGVNIEGYQKLLSYLPLYNMGIGWLVPAIIGTVIGTLIYKTRKAEIVAF